MAKSPIEIATENSKDWMRELEADATKWKALVQRIDTLARIAIGDIARHEHLAAGIKLAEIREGLGLLCEMSGVKIVQENVSLT